MNLGVMTQQIIVDTHLQVSQSTVWRKIIDSIRFHREKHLWFSERTFSMSLKQGVFKYRPGDGSGLPKGLQEIVGKYLWVLINGSQDARYSVERLDTASFEKLRATTSSSQPVEWTIFENTLQLHPTPNSSSDTLEGRYVVDIGIPLMTIDQANNFLFQVPDGSATLTNAYSNDWFLPGSAEALIRARATYLIQSQVVHDDSAAQAALLLWQELLMQIEDETEGKTGSVMLAPKLLD